MFESWASVGVLGNIASKDDGQYLSLIKILSLMFVISDQGKQH